MNPATYLTPLGNGLINFAHIARVYFTTDLDLKIHFVAMDEPRASMNYAPPSDKPLVLTIKRDTAEYNEAVDLFGLADVLEVLEQDAAIERAEKEKKQGRGKP